MCCRLLWKRLVMTLERVRKPESLNSHKPQNYITLSVLQRENGFSPTGGDFKESWLPQGETEKMVWLILSLFILSCLRQWAFRLDCIVWTCLVTLTYHRTKRGKCILLAKKNRTKVFCLQTSCLNCLNSLTVYEYRHAKLSLPCRWQQWAPLSTGALWRPTFSGTTTSCQESALSTLGAASTSSGRPSEPHQQPQATSKSSPWEMISTRSVWTWKRSMRAS